VDELPEAVVTVRSTVPAEPAGLTAVIDVAELTVKLDAGVDPKSTAVAASRLVPVTVTDVPPDKGPAAGLIADTVGAAS
jgi:hypothetical protein